MDVIEKFGNRVSSQALKDPEKARRLLLAGYRLQEKKLQFLPDRGLPSSGQYVVRSGDTVSGIAAKLGVSMSAIHGYANINLIYPGQVLTY